MECKFDMDENGKEISPGVDLTRMECKLCTACVVWTAYKCVDLTRMECK